MAYKKKPEEPKKGAPEYMNTYGDLVTLLLCFFVLLYSMSTIDVAKFLALAQSFSNNVSLVTGNQGNILDDTGAGLLPEVSLESPSSEDGPGGETEEDEEYSKKQEISKMSSDFKTYLAQNEATSQITVEDFGEYMLIRFPDGIMFDSGKADLKPEAINVLNFVFNELTKYPGHEIKVEGHTDNVPMRSDRFPDNYYLSSARADTVVLYLIDMGFDPLLLSPQGKSEYWPIASNDTPEGRAQNRRVELKVYAKQDGGTVSASSMESSDE